jgi:hypothetical protein
LKLVVVVVVADGTDLFWRKEFVLFKTVYEVGVRYRE